MDRKEHQAWLAQLAAEDLRKRAEAEPELVRKEAALRQAQVGLKAAQAAVAEMEAELEHARQDAEGDDGPDDLPN